MCSSPRACFSITEGSCIRAASRVDVTARKRAEAGLLARARQQQAVASLGELALRERDVQKVFERATAAVADTLDVEYCKVLELLPGGREVLLRAGVGWKEGLVGSARVGTGADSQAGYTLASGAPVIVRDLRTEPRFRGPPLLTEHGVVSGMSCIIRGAEGEAWGVLGTHATRLIEFTDDDVSFLTAVANILGYAIQRERAEAALRESDRRKDEFIAMLSHELRNPLAPLRSALEVLRLRSAGDEDVRTMMERQVSHLVRLVDDLLETSRISRGLLELRREPVQVTDVLRSAVESAEPLVREFGHRLELDLPSEPLWLRGDPVRLAQTFANLLNNAARYTPRGGNIWLRATREHDAEVCVSVRDSGLGFTLEAKARLFEMFSRGEGSSGLGIGLALVRKLVEMHGGSVEAHSEGEGRGAEFLVRLPLDRAPAGAARVETGAMPTAAPTECSSRTTIEMPPKVLRCCCARSATKSASPVMVSRPSRQCMISVPMSCCSTLACRGSTATARRARFAAIRSGETSGWWRLPAGDRKRTAAAHARRALTPIWSSRPSLMPCGACLPT